MHRIFSHSTSYGWPAWFMAACFAGLTSEAVAQPEIYGQPDSSRFIWIPAESGDWTRHFRLGGLAGLNIGASFHEAGAFNLSGNNLANGIYDDGYVRMDQTGNAGGYTSYWGYNNASQYNAAAQTITLHSAASYTTAGSANVDGGIFPGFDLAYGDNYWYWKHARVGWELGFGLLPVSISDHQPLAAAINQTAYTFNTGGILVPGAPYQGGPSGQGPLLATTPSGSAVGSLASGTVTGSRSLEVMIYTLRLGALFYWDLTDRLGMSLGGGPAVGIVSGEYRYNETIVTGAGSTANSGNFGATDITFGGYVSGTLLYHVQDAGRNADIFLGIQYMPLGEANFNHGGRSGQLNLDGQLYISAGISWPF